MGDGDRVGVVEQGVDQRKANGVRFGASGGRAEQAGLGGGELLVDGGIALPGVGVECQLAWAAGASERAGDRGSLLQPR